MKPLWQQITDLTQRSGRRPRPHSASPILCSNSHSVSAQDGQRLHSTVPECPRLGPPVEGSSQQKLPQRPRSASFVRRTPWPPSQSSHHATGGSGVRGPQRRPWSAAPVMQLQHHCPEGRDNARCRTPHASVPYTAKATIPNIVRPHIVHVEAVTGSPTLASLGPEKSCPAVLGAHDKPRNSYDRPMILGGLWAHRTTACAALSAAGMPSTKRWPANHDSALGGGQVHLETVDAFRTAPGLERANPSLQPSHRVAPESRRPRPSTAHAAFCTSAHPAKSSGLTTRHSSASTAQEWDAPMPAGHATSMLNPERSCPKLPSQYCGLQQRSCTSTAHVALVSHGSGARASESSAHPPGASEMLGPERSWPTLATQSKVTGLGRRPLTAHARLCPSSRCTGALTSASAHTHLQVPTSSQVKAAVQSTLTSTQLSFPPAQPSFAVPRPRPYSAATCRRHSSPTQQVLHIARPSSAPSILRSKHSMQPNRCYSRERSSAILKAKEAPHLLRGCSQAIEEATDAAHTLERHSKNTVEGFAVACVRSKLLPQPHDTVGPLATLGLCPLHDHPFSQLSPRSTSSQVCFEDLSSI
jgi:hypothetical protein